MTPSVRTIAFTISENAMLNFIIFILFFAIFIIFGRLPMLFDISSASALLSAISEASPMAIPKSDSAKTGLSFIPSPINITFPFSFRFFTFSNFCFGSKPSNILLIPTLFAILLALSSLSPVSIIVSAIPTLFNFSDISKLLSLISSLKVMLASTFPSTIK